MAKGKICPVCGKHTFEELDYYEICPVCGWEDDPFQREDADEDGGANGFSLNEYKFIYQGLLKGEDLDELKQKVFDRSWNKD